MSEEQSYAGPERRKYRRIPFSFPVRFKELRFDEDGLTKEGMTQYAYSNDLSLEGIKLKFLEDVAIGKFLKLKLTLPFENGCIALNAEGEVIWTQFDPKDKVHVVGVKFMEMDDDDRETLEEFISISLKGVSDVPDENQPQEENKTVLTPDRIVQNLDRPIKVLVVDDEKNVRYILNLKLAMKKVFSVEVAANGKEALEKIRVNKPDLIILDVMLPGMDGFEVCRILKKGQETSTIPVIFLTAMNQVNDVIRSIRVGVDDYITKPYEFEDLFTQMMKVVNSSTTTKRLIAD